MNAHMLTAGCKILMSAARLEEAGSPQFTAEDLILSAWKEFPQTFGMIGHESAHPDTNRTMTYVLGKRGLVSKDELQRVSPKLYRLTPLGRRKAYTVASECHFRTRPDRKAPGAPQLSPEQDALLVRVVGSMAWKKANSRMFDRIEFGEAAAFWGFGEHNDHPVIEEARRAFDKTMDEIVVVFLSQASAVLSSGHVAVGRDVAAVRELSLRLTDRFAYMLEFVKFKNLNREEDEGDDSRQHPPRAVKAGGGRSPYSRR